MNNHEPGSRFSVILADVNNHEPRSRCFFTRYIFHITYSLLEKYGYEKIIAALLHIPTIEYHDLALTSARFCARVVSLLFRVYAKCIWLDEIMTLKFLRYGEPRKLQVITFSKPRKRARLKQTCCAHIYTFSRAKISFIWYKFCFATIYLS